MRTSLTMETTPKITQRDIAKKLGLSPSYLSEILRRIRRPSWDVAKVLAYATGTDPEFWMESGSPEALKNAIAQSFHEPTEEPGAEDRRRNQFDRRHKDRRRFYDRRHD